MKRPSHLVLLVVVVVTSALGACDRAAPDRADGRARSEDTVPTGRFASVHAAVCASAAAAAAGDAAAAERRFEDAHGALHDLATAVEARDRAVAARLLEAKQAVEAGGDAAARAELATAVGAAVEAAGGAGPKACPGGAAPPSPAVDAG